MEEQGKRRDLSVRPAAEPTAAADFLNDGETEVHLLGCFTDWKVKIFFQIVHRHSTCSLPLLRFKKTELSVYSVLICFALFCSVFTNCLLYMRIFTDLSCKWCLGNSPATQFRRLIRLLIHFHLIFSLFFIVVSLCNCRHEPVNKSQSKIS